LIDACVAGEMVLVLSELTLRELEAAPEAVIKTVARGRYAGACARLPLSGTS